MRQLTYLKGWKVVRGQSGGRKVVVYALWLVWNFQVQHGIELKLVGNWRSDWPQRVKVNFTWSLHQETSKKGGRVK